MSRPSLVLLEIQTTSRVRCLGGRRGDRLDLHRNVLVWRRRSGRPVLDPCRTVMPVNISNIGRCLHDAVCTTRYPCPVWRSLVARSIPTTTPAHMTDICRRVAVEADGPWHYSLSRPHVPLAHSVMKWRCLSLRGWRVLSIPFFEWKALGGDAEKRDYMLSALQGTLWRQRGSAAGSEQLQA